MHHTHLFSIKLILLLLQSFIVINSQCPPNSTIEPCLCIENNSSDTYLSFNATLTESIPIRQKSIVCAHINNSSFNLHSVFIKLSTLLLTDDQSLSENRTHFNDFLLYNTQIKHLPKNLSENIIFSTIILNDNPLLYSIDIDAFNNTRNSITVFRTLNTNLSNSDILFTILKQFHNLRFLQMENDKLHSIPDYAFNHTELRYIWLGVPATQTFQPLVRIGKFPFYNLPNLTSLRIFSPVLTKIGKYSLATNKRSISTTNDLNDMLHIDMGGSMLNASSFESTSLTRFRNRPVFLRLYNTSIDYLDELIFQPFFETNPLSLLDVQGSPISRICDYRSFWVKNDYCTQARVYGTSCCSLDLFDK